MKIIFMGTPDIAVPALEKIIEAGHEVLLVVSQPDKPVGRSKALKPTAVKECALAHNIPVYQPVKIRLEESVAYLQQFKADVIVVEAFGQIIPQAVLDIPKYCCVNIHTSLLPKYRGAAPIQWAVLNGDKLTGVTTMRMDAGLDTGDIIMQKEILLNDGETSETLFDRLAEAGADLIVKTLTAIEDGTAVYTPQDAGKVTHTSKITKEMGSIDWSRSAKELECWVRGMDPWPSAYTKLEDKNIKIWKAKVLAENTEAKAGTIVRVTKNSIDVQTGDGILSILELQIEGKKRMTANAFLCGCQVKEGIILKRG